MNKKPTHPELVRALAKPGEEIASTMSAFDAHLIHMIIGISGEAGELLDAIKKATIYKKQIDINNVIEELGDIEFYLEGLREALAISRDETLEANIAKLSERYATMSYSDDQAQSRADKK